uniref:Laminin, alpha 1 n=1 Tax=Dicentrarchus labrax TaxID=13489 RepID=A0A8P4GTB8_DICLA
MERAAAQQRGLFPAILNLASNAVISSNATCGDPEPEVYCKLVEHVPGRRIKNPHCPKCDANSILSKERHPITNAIDGTNQWWQSPSIKNGRQFHWITVTLDLKQIFQVAYIIIKAANSPRPGNWILERSLDGVTFDPWQFYAISDSECLTRYNVTPRLGPPTYKRDTEVICTSYYSRLNPLEHGEIHTSLINGRPGADDLTSDLLNFTSARYIRLRLQRIRTLNADLMTLSARDPRDIDPIVTRRYVLSLSIITPSKTSLWVGCVSKLQCVCEHNTCGESCNKCCPGYHQQPWQPGTVSEGNTCEKCNCHNKAVDCFYNQTVSELSLSLNTHGVRQGGGVCMNCQQNTAGINCETCTAGNYRPAEVSPYSDSPCVQCNCDLRGSESSTCTRDMCVCVCPGVSAGQCRCKEGFTGRQCDRCAFGFRDFPLCTQCECNLSGSINTDPCSPCTCKVNVMGAHCDLCKPGFYNLQDNHPLGCTDCFCFGVSDVCESSAWSTTQVTHRSTPLLRGFLNYSVVYDLPLDNEDHSLPGHFDIIIEGNGRTLHLSPPLLLFLSPLAERSVAVMIASQRFVDVQTGVHVIRDDLLSVLADVTSLRVRVHLNASADGPIRLRSVSLDVADSGSVSGVQAVAVEMCECPWGYSGTSCEACLPGFYRVGGVLFGGNCMQCECNDHTIECDINGVCLGCTHNTTGPHCEHCLPGFYGDATEGTPDDCRLCPCPLTEPSNSFSPTCVLEASGQVSCDRCQDGYTGTKCERCASGFYGNPQVVGGVCVRCECNGNVDISKAGHCDTVTGDCLRCLGNTAGRHCEVCQPGYYGDALHAKDCQECGCDVSGALSSVCDVTTGQCLCRENVTGRTCNHCQSGFFGLQSGQGCQACGCSQSRSLSESCDAGGRCQCVEGVAGHKCDSCSRGYYGFHANGCTACICDHTGGNCDPETGDCICPAHTQGDTCDRCETGYWGHNPATGCQVRTHTYIQICTNTHRCVRIHTVTSFYFFSRAAALQQEAPPLSAILAMDSVGAERGSLADHVTNVPLVTMVFQDAQCVAATWPEQTRSSAIQRWECVTVYTLESVCARYTTSVCNNICVCVFIHKYNNNICVCVQVGVSGQRCEECVSGWFALSADGCSQCFCSGLSSDCEEKGGLYRVPISLARYPALLSLVSQSNLHGILSGVYQQGGDMLLDTRQLNTSRLAGPLYWRLPPQFEGHQLLSYGGLLSYIITFYAEDGLGLSNQEPQILIRGGTLRKLVIYTDMVAPGNGIRTQHDIRLTEHNWKYFNSVLDKSVSRADFLSVLSNIEYVIIKASYGTRLQQSRISNITMETAVDAELKEGSVVGGGVARLIESCVCPPGYSGLSCQECAAGFFRQSLSELSPHTQKSLFVRPCVQCRCNNHSESCDTETGECQGCQHHTSGPGCELCAPGYYGNISGSISDCSLCACPLRGNSFSPTCVSEGAFGDFRCTACQMGYEGRYCERCSVGYYGNPSVPGGMCSQCSCSGWGSLQPLCDALSGQCECKAGVKGRSCDQCEERHILQEGECVSCDDECTGVLLDDLEKIYNHFLSVNLSGVAMAPYHQLVLLQNQTTDAQVNAAAPGAPRCGSLQLREAGHLNQTTEEEFSSANQTRLLGEVESMLETIRVVNLTAANTAANQELRCVFVCLYRLYNQVEEFSGQLDQWRPLLRKQVDALVVGLKMTDALENVYRAESHAHLLQSHAHSLSSSHSVFFSYLHQPINQSIFYPPDLQLTVSMVTSRLGLVRESVHNSSLLFRQPIRELQNFSNGERGVSANEAQSKLEEAEHRTDRLMDRIKPLSMLGETLSRNLSDIRELIDQARRQAASIKVAVQADRDCVRSYRPQIESSNFNTLSLILKTSSPDNLLFYLSSNTTVDFLAVEMHDGKVSLAWDVGSGSTRLDFPGLDIANNRWTRINATRFGAHGSLSVHQLESESAPLPAVTATSRGPSRVLDIDRNTVIHIGGLGAHTQSPTTLRSSTFQGCLGEASLNERNIGLWNYNSREGECGGCFSSPQAEETSFHFDGSGFSLVQKSLRATSTSIVLLFKTLSPGGLLLYLASNNTRDFLSMELVEGRVRLTFDLGSGALILTSNRKYNTGVWYKITLQRSKRKGYLSIMAADQSTEKEVLEAESPGTASDLNRSDLDPIYIGGLPASRPIRRQVVSRSYVGCIKNVEIARSNFDLLRDAFGVRKGCVLEAVRSVSVLAGGFVQIAPRSLGQEVELFLSFSTNNQSGVVLAAFSDDPTHRQVRQTHTHTHLGSTTRRVMVVKPVGGSFSDGIKHSVIITINRKSLSMQVDEDHRKSVSLSPGGFSRLSPASFFIAGLPSEGGPHLPIRLQDVSRLIVDLSEAVRYEGVELDSCLLEERDGGAVLPDDQDVEPTKDPAYLPVPPPTHLSALTPGALTVINMFFCSNTLLSVFVLSVLVRLSVRSRALDGLILLLSDSKQMDFIVLRLTGGRLMMSADLGKGPASITSSVTVNDGKWHIVSAEMSRRLLSVSVDGSSPDSVSVKGNQLDVDNRLYLGGVPHTHTARRINVSSSFPGCIRGVSLNAAMLDLSKPVSLHDVTSCFTTEQTGSYFNGSGYAALMPEGYKVGSDVLVSLEFRTSQSEGVFLGISSAKVDAIGLEMINGQVVFNVNNGAGRVSVHSIGQMLCDGQWHRLLARKTKHTLSLSVDGRSYSTPNPYPQSTSAETNNPVYLGGYPVSVKQNCLSINSRFRGCLRNLQLVKSHLTDALNLSSAHFLLGVTPNSCPVA